MPIDVEKLKKVRIKGWARGGGFALILQPIENLEAQEVFGPFESREAALAFHDDELVKPYTEEVSAEIQGKAATKLLRKSFRKGGPLEMVNPLRPDQLDKDPDIALQGHGIWEIAMQVIEWEVVPDDPA